MTEHTHESEAARLQAQHDDKLHTFQRKQEHMLEKHGLLDTAAGRLFVHGKMGRLIDRVDAAFDVFLGTHRFASRSGEIKGWLREVSRADRRVMIAVAAVTLFEGVLIIGTPVTAGHMSRSLGEAIMREWVLLKIKREYPHSYASHLASQLGPARMTWGFFRAHFERLYSIPVSEHELDYRLRNHLGQVFFETILRNTDIIDTELTTELTGVNKRRNVLLVRPTPKFYDELAEVHSHLLQILPSDHVPLYTPPVEWTSPDAGGYPNNSFLFMKGMNGPDDCPGITDVPDIYRCVNTHQSTEWRIRQHTADLITEFWNGSALLADMPEREPVRVAPPLKTAEWKQMEPKPRRAYALERRLALRQERHNLTARGRMTRFVRSLEQHKDKSIWFPASIDFRGRMYAGFPFGPQADDRTRSCLEFAQGRPIENDIAMDWLKIHGANLYGVKGTFKERTEWADSVALERESLVSVGPDGPARSWWEEAKDPWQFYSWADEMRRAEAGDPVHMPVSMDGTCHGLQLWSLLLRDADLAKVVNVTDSPDAPHDLYQQLADEANEYLNQFDHPMAEILRGVGVDRSFVKPVLMSLPFGLSVFSVKERIQRAIDEHFTTPHNMHFKAAFWFAKPLFLMAKRLAGSTLDGLTWLKSYARAAVALNQQPIWTSPSGLQVKQRHQKKVTELVRLSSLGCKFRLRHAYLTDEPSAALNIRAVAANYIHSLDAALLTSSLNKATDSGVTDFTMIHDCYGVHPNDAHTMAASAHAAVTEMFNVNLLGRLADEAQERYAVTLDKPPIVGTLDVPLTGLSPYFFS